MAKITKSLLILGFAAFVFFAHGAASQGGQNSLVLERELRDALMNNPPFSTPAPESVAPANPPPNTQAALPPAQVQPAYTSAPAPPPSAIPEMCVRGYSIDPSGAINVIGMDGVLMTVDGSRPVKLFFPPEYGLAPQIVGGTRPASQPYPASQPVEIAVRGYSIHPSGAIVILGMDGVVRTLDGSRQVTLVFPPEYGIPPQTVGGSNPSVGQMQVNSPAPGMQQSTGAMPPQVVIGDQPAPPASVVGDLTAGIIQEGIGAILNQIKKR